MEKRIICVGIDVSKSKFDCAVADWKGKIVFGSKEYAQDRDGFISMKNDVEEVATELHADILLGCESTGIYHLSLVEFCNDNKMSIRVFNALELKKYHRSKIRRDRNDPIDAKTIAKGLVIESDFPDGIEISPEVKTLRELTRIRTRISNLSVLCKTRITRNLDVICRGYVNCFADIMCPSSIALIKKCVQLTKPFQRTERDLAEILKEARHPEPVEKAKEIQAVFDKAVIPKGLLEPYVIEIKVLLDQHELYQEQLEKLEERIERLVENLDTPVKTINGIGKVNAGIILGEIGSINRFSNVDELVAFAGLDASVRESGQYEAQTRHISKRGSPYLRSALYMSAVSAMKCNPVCKAFADRLKKKDKKKKVIIVAVSRELLTIIYSVLKNNRPFSVPKYIEATVI
jgi:transposase